MKIQLQEHTCEKQTQWGAVTQSLNQHKVFIETDEGKLAQCGYVGVKDFLPLCGFPKELVEPVRAECEKQLNRKLGSVDPPPSFTQIAEMIAVQQAASESELDDDSEDDE